ncbi:MAG: GIY-YIG nuclease family protein [Rhodothermales bacterium]|nr:GIY-YIG nuclease family protein [Rhodothermales bacterium]
MAAVLQLLLPDDHARGLRRLNVVLQSSVFALHLPRTRYKDAVDEWGDELSGVGLYFLLRHADGEARPRVYIGQTEDVAQRFKSHLVQKAFWTHALVVLDPQFDTAKVRFLEWLCEAEARKAARYAVENTNTPSKPKLDKATESVLRQTFKTVDLLVTTLGAPLFEPFDAPSTADALPLPAAPVLLPDDVPLPAVKPLGSSPQDSLQAMPVPPLPVACRCTRRGADARGMFDGKSVTVLAGSVLSATTTASGVQKNVGPKRDELKRHGHLVEEDGRLVFAKDYTFKTPSAAVELVMGSSANGWTEWKLDDGRPLKIYQT